MSLTGASWVFPSSSFSEWWASHQAWSLTAAMVENLHTIYTYMDLFFTANWHGGLWILVVRDQSCPAAECLWNLALALMKHSPQSPDSILELQVLSSCPPNHVWVQMAPMTLSHRNNAWDVYVCLRVRWTRWVHISLSLIKLIFLNRKGCAWDKSGFHVLWSQLSETMMSAEKPWLCGVCFLRVSMSAISLWLATGTTMLLAVPTLLINIDNSIFLVLDIYYVIQSSQEPLTPHYRGTCRALGAWQL